jgi:hypothetical protein
MMATIKLAVVNAYLDVFGRFELGIKLLVSLVFPAKIKSIFEGLFACYKREAALGLGNDMVRAARSLLCVAGGASASSPRWGCAPSAADRGLLCSVAHASRIRHACWAKRELPGASVTYRF